MSPRDAATAAATPLGLMRPDTRDLRDRFFEPALTPLGPRLDPDPALLAAIAAGAARLLPRDQGEEGSCGGHALAALIDIERLRAATEAEPAPPPVSARMIQSMAARHDAAFDAEAGVALRDVIKGFYNYGVCPEAAWPYLAADLDRTLTAPRAEAARDVALGAYYRLRPNLNVYHSALRETGAVLVSAELHSGWAPEAVAAAGGCILRPAIPEIGGLYSGGHAFVLVGYDAKGFLVLNSWGRGWGGLPVGGAPCPGIAHWSYGDWADAIMDGWALRLGVRAPEAFEFSIGEMGLGFAGPVSKSRPAPVRAVLGHYLHLDDGHYVERGDYACDRAGLAETFRVVREGAAGDGRYRGLLLTFAGALLNLGDAAAQVAQLKAELWKDRAQTGRTWYPITALWCVDYVDEARAVLEGVFAEAVAQAGKGPELDRLIEARAHGVGRALWRDLRYGAERAARPDGPFVDLLEEAAGVAAVEPAFGLRVFAEGEGVFALDALVATLARSRRLAGVVYPMLRSVDVVAPPETAERFATMAGRLVAGWKAARVPVGALRLHLPAAADEARLAVPPYGGSYFDLVAAGFLRAPRADAAAGGRRARGIAARWSPWLRPRRVEARPIAWREDAAPAAIERLTQRELIYGSDVIGRVRAAIADEPTT